MIAGVTVVHGAQSTHPLPRVQRMAGQEFRRGHPAAAFTLQQGDAHGVRAAGNDDPVFVRPQNGSRRAGIRHDGRLPDFQHLYEAARRNLTATARFSTEPFAREMSN